MGRRELTEDYFRKRIRREREALKWSQDELAKRMSENGVPAHATTVAKIEAGTRSIRLEEAAVVADLFALSLDSLLGRKGGLQDELTHAVRALQRFGMDESIALSTKRGAFGMLARDVLRFDFEGVEIARELMEKADVALETVQSALYQVAAMEFAISGNEVGPYDAEVERRANEKLRKLVTEIEATREGKESQKRAKDG